ncbi:MAG: aldehyde dehydrogenase family protein [Mobilibacterium timonense]|uniref:aldehyde dehydrogenase family protein n=1 Tax=Mobilibacterium timonense TaxID=1871012 RepID=UPI00235449E7|nr:aldehyde dehydrogenase family protein [Mobilibacterium timonense]MBM6990220.1 aldehyde dehydrogenase family protein [Mobilibacterium timonense]
MELEKWKMYINGEWTGALGDACINVENPATGECFAEVPEASTKDVENAVTSAKEAFKRYRHFSNHDRAELLRSVSRIINYRKGEFADTITREIGMPVKYCEKFQVESSADEAQYFADVAESYEYEKRYGNGWMIKEPYGTAAFITPWNYPLDQVTIKTFAAIAAGCTVIVKPSIYAPVSTLMLAQVFEEAGCPAGLFNVITGAKNDIGEILANHKAIDLFSFTGSTRGGEYLGGRAIASTAKKVILELGGKSAALILEGADIEAAVRETLDSVFINSGQTCNAYTRLIVPERYKKKIEKIASTIAEEYVVGDPLNPAVDVGPVINGKASVSIIEKINGAKEEGARVIFEGRHSLRSGHFVNPVILSDVTSDMKIAEEEIFGPVLSIMTYRDVDEAVEMVNSTRYGLDGTIWGGYSEAVEIAGRINAGNIHINGAGYDVNLPFGGYKESGVGREGGVPGFEEYLQIKSLFCY